MRIGPREGGEGDDEQFKFDFVGLDEPLELIKTPSEPQSDYSKSILGLFMKNQNLPEKNPSALQIQMRESISDLIKESGNPPETSPPLRLETSKSEDPTYQHKDTGSQADLYRHSKSAVTESKEPMSPAYPHETSESSSQPESSDLPKKTRSSNEEGVNRKLRTLTTKVNI